MSFRRITTNYLKMIPKDKKYVLVAIYLYICKIYGLGADDHISFAVTVERRTKITEIYDFANSYLKSWFLDIPFYPTFVVRLNRLSCHP